MTPAATTGTLVHNGARLVFTDVSVLDAEGRLPFVFQHGMGGDTAQPIGYIGDDPPTRVVAMNARGHSPSSDIDQDAASFDVFADDVIALADQLGIERFTVGGISLGAGTALNLTVRYPDRVAALVLCRPAWLDEPQADFNRAAYVELADLLDRHPDDATTRYAVSDTYREVQRTSPAAAASLFGQLTRPRAAENAVILRAFPAIRPTESSSLWRSITVPTLVIGHHDDPFHPYAIAQAHADAIPGAMLYTVPSKDADPARFASEIRTALGDFLRQ